LRWTSAQDDILIQNYESYKEISSKTMRFEALARLVLNKTARQCYERASTLKLKKGDMLASKAISDQLQQKEDQAEKDSQVALSLKKLCLGLVSDLNQNKAGFLVTSLQTLMPTVRG
jgi:hypothetical protein